MKDAVGSSLGAMMHSLKCHLFIHLAFAVCESHPDQSLSFKVLWYVLQPWKCWGNCIPSLLIYFQLEARIFFACCLQLCYQVSVCSERAAVSCTRAGCSQHSTVDPASDRGSSSKCLPGVLRCQEVKGAVWPLRGCACIPNGRAAPKAVVLFHVQN